MALPQHRRREYVASVRRIRWLFYPSTLVGARQGPWEANATVNKHVTRLVSDWYRSNYLAPWRRHCHTHAQASSQQSSSGCSKTRARSHGAPVHANSAIRLWMPKDGDHGTPHNLPLDSAKGGPLNFGPALYYGLSSESWLAPPDCFGSQRPGPADSKWHGH